MHPVVMLRFINKYTGVKTLIWVIWMTIALSVEARPAAHWWAKGGYRQPRWKFPCQTPGSIEQAALPWEDDQLFTLADTYKHIFEKTIVLRLKVKALMDRYEKQHIQDSMLADMLKNEYYPVRCLIPAKFKNPIPLEDGVVVDKALVQTLTAFNKLAKYVSYFDVTTKMYFEDGGRIMDTDSLEQSDVTESIYNIMCDLHSVLKRRHGSLPDFVINDVIKAEECLAGERFDNHFRYIRDFAILNNFDKILEVVKNQFEDLFGHAEAI